jgi:hypothetical protein
MPHSAAVPEEGSRELQPVVQIHQRTQSDPKPLPKSTEKPMKILMVLTSHDRLGDTGRKTGFWLEEFAAPLL